MRLFTGSTKSYEFTPQFFFDESLTSVVRAKAPCSSKGTRNVVNTGEGIYNSLSATAKSALTLQATANGSGYVGMITLGVQIG